ncbi:alpha-galactosidase [Histidinibacterium aquaticum]|nr:alpha-galactosidase [Histidinibacterium aquaticum]
MLQDDRQSLLLVSTSEGLPQIVYWGPPIAADEVEVIARATQRDVTGGMLDRNPDLSICPEESASFPGQPGLLARNPQGKPLRPRFRFTEDWFQGTSLSLTYRDEVLGLTYWSEFGLDSATGMVTARAYLEAEELTVVDWFAAPVFPVSEAGTEMIDFAGRWCGEMRTQRVPWSAGIRSREGRTGRTGHENLPLIYLPEAGATNTQGRAEAFHYGWSGGHRMVAEELPDGRRQVQFGHTFQSESAARRRFETATLFACRSDYGLNGCAVVFQRYLRDRVVPWPNPARPRPVHYNCWEAVYFGHSMERLGDIATRAADLGAERFVLDDGWFGRRDNDTSSLGDWWIDRRKWPDGLGPLITHVKKLGMTFGIWFEPEMVNPDSELYRNHRDWALGRTDQVLGRGQMVLDMGREEVRNYLFEAMSGILSEHDIEYVKWDHNRVLPQPDASQVRGTYALIDKLRAAHPEVEFESCASGGGRIDFGILGRMHRIWLSDSNDALERLRIQHEASLLLPLAVSGSHVGPRHSHTSGRVHDIRFRAWVAAQRHMGFEMDPAELTVKEAEVLRDAIAWWKENRDWMTKADILRLDSSDPALVAEAQVAHGGERFVVFAGQAAASSQILPRPLRLAGLEPGARYRVSLRNAADSLPNLSRGSPALKEGPLELSGQYLMGQGVCLPWSFPEHMWVLEGRRI